MIDGVHDGGDDEGLEIRVQWAVAGLQGSQHLRQGVLHGCAAVVNGLRSVPVAWVAAPQHLELGNALRPTVTSELQ